jgi:sulfur-oxidizing protein SoxY
LTPQGINSNNDPSLIVKTEKCGALSVRGCGTFINNLKLLRLFGDGYMQITKRMIIKSGLALLTLASLPRILMAAAWPQVAFGQSAASEALTTLLGSDVTIPSDRIDLKLPAIAENGAVVPVSINTTLEDVESISIVVKNNPRPMAATFEIPPGTLPKITTRIKMGETSDVMAVIKTGNGIYSTSGEVKVTIGGCGG